MILQHLQCKDMSIAENNQDYIEDCEVCCNPIKINVVFNNSELISLNSASIEQ